MCARVRCVRAMRACNACVRACVAVVGRGTRAVTRRHCCAAFVMMCARVCVCACVRALVRVAAGQADRRLTEAVVVLPHHRQAVTWEWTQCATPTRCMGRPHKHARTCTQGSGSSRSGEGALDLHVLAGPVVRPSGHQADALHHRHARGHAPKHGVLPCRRRSAAQCSTHDAQAWRTHAPSSHGQGARVMKN